MAKQSISVLAGICVSLLVVQLQATDISSGVSNQIYFYQALQNFALPGVSLAAESDSEEPVLSQRFTLTIPGMVLNPVQYDPGPAYRESLANPADALPEVNIPLRVQEAMHNLADVVPSLNPLSGVTGDSFSRTYTTILNMLDIKGFTEQTQELQRRYTEAQEYLTSPRKDPENIYQEITLLGLYSRYQQRYYRTKLRNENIIEAKRNGPAIDYQLWFQKNYPSINADNENAYTEWLLYGEKVLVESYKGYLDIVTSAGELEEAREVLRAVGVPSLDRSTTIYPVTFTPSNWYQYLVPSIHPLTKDQLQQRISDLEARIALLTAVKNHEHDPTDKQDYFNEVDGAVTSAVANTEAKAEALEQERFNCRRAQDMNRKLQSSFSSDSDSQPIKDPPDECAGIASAERALETATQEAAAALAAKAAVYGEYGDGSILKSQVVSVIERLENQLAEYENQLQSATTALPSYVLNANGTRELTTVELDDQWTQFSFSSASESTATDSRSFQSMFKYGANSGFWRNSGGAYTSNQTQFTKDVYDANITVNCKFLKVAINRRWLRTTLFRNSDFISRRQGVYVSPGPSTEETFLDVASRSTYILPQYVTAFLLAKDINLEFSSMASEKRDSALKVAASSYASGGWGPFSFSASSTYGAMRSHTQSQSTSDGLHISIPGAQIIGYYTDVIPKFPFDQDIILQ